MTARMVKTIQLSTRLSAAHQEAADHLGTHMELFFGSTAAFKIVELCGSICLDRFEDVITSFGALQLLSWNER